MNVGDHNAVPLFDQVTDKPVIGANLIGDVTIFAVHIDIAPDNNLVGVLVATVLLDVHPFLARLVIQFGGQWRIGAHHAYPANDPFGAAPIQQIICRTGGVLKIWGGF